MLSDFNFAVSVTDRKPAPSRTSKKNHSRKRQSCELVSDDSQYLSSDLNSSSPQTPEVKADENRMEVAEKRLKENGKDTCLDNPEKTDGIETSVPSLCVQSPSESEGEEEGVEEQKESRSREEQRVEALNENEQRISKGQPEPNEEEKQRSAGECHSPTRSSSEHFLCTPITLNRCQVTVFSVTLSLICEILCASVLFLYRNQS